MRIFLSGLVLVLALAALAACGGQEAVVTEPDAEPVTVTETVEVGATEETETEEPEETTTEEAPPEPDVARIGDSISVAGYESGYQVTLVKVKNNPPHDEFLPPSRGNRYYAAYIKVKVTDGSPTEVCASNDASIVDSESQEFTASVVDAAEPGFGCPRIAVGKERAGWVTFEVPKRAKLVTFVYTPDAGFAEESGEWEL